MRLICKLVVVLSLSITNSYASEKISWEYKHLPSEVLFNLPYELAVYMSLSKEGKPFEVDDSINPMYLRADIDGDGRHEYVVLIKNIEDDLRGILIYFDPKKTAVLFAGVTPVKKISGISGKETSINALPRGIDMWSVYLGKVVIPNSFTPMPTPKGEMIMFGKSESWMSMFYWDGSEYVFYNLGG